MPEKIYETYQVVAHGITVSVSIADRPKDFVKGYNVTLLTISPTTQVVLDKLRELFLVRTEVKTSSSMFKVEEISKVGMTIREDFEREIRNLITEYFPNLQKETVEVLVNYSIIQNLGLGNIELVLKDPYLEEICVNGSSQPVWVYHKKYGWLKTNIFLPSERTIWHYSTLIGRDVGKDITVLNPLMDASLRTGDRINATLKPVSSDGNTITIRKFAARPWTILDFITNNTIPIDAAAFIWTAIQYEMSTLISGGTGSGKTSALNVISNFFPPNQRVISIEDTREIQLPKSIHWVPMKTRSPNPEGKGGVSMLDLVVNALRMRPDRIIVGEIRRKKEAEVLFEAMHTGHSVYATIHANDAPEVISRLTNPPIDIPKSVIPSLSIILAQYRNRRTGRRRTIQVAEVLPSGDANVVMQLNVKKDVMQKLREPTTIQNKLNFFTGMSKQELAKDVEHRVNILKAMCKYKDLSVNQVGYIISKFYIDKNFKISAIPDYVKEVG